MNRKSITASGAAAVGPYSHAVESGGFVFLSGQTPVDHATGKLVEGSIRAQTETCFKNLGAVLSAAGLSMADVVSVQVFLTDMKDFAEMNSAYETVFEKPFPARTTIGVASLPRGARVEIAMTAKTKG